jgi:hypothetical protein
MRPRLVLIAAALAATVVAAGGCGQSADHRSELSRAVPAGATFYLEFQMRPHGALRRDALAAAGTILKTGDPAGRIHDLLRQISAREDHDFDTDVEPWLGDRAAVWVGRPRGGDTPVLLAIGVRDDDAAQEKFDRDAQRHGRIAHRTAGGTSYEVAGGHAQAIVDHVELFGDEAPLRRALTMRDGGDLGHSRGYRDAVAGLESSRLGTAYVDLGGFLSEAAAKAPNPVAASVVRAMFAGIRPLAVSINARRGAIVLDGPRRPGPPPATPSLAPLPGDSAYAFGLGDAGRKLGKLVIGSLSAAGVGGPLGQLLHQSTNRLSWLRDVIFSVRASRPVGFAGLARVTTGRVAEAMLRSLRSSLGRQGLRVVRVRARGADDARLVTGGGLPRPIVFERFGTNLVVLYGPSPASGAPPKLGRSPLFQRARAALGADRLQGLASVANLVALYRSRTQAALNPLERQILGSLDVVAAGDVPDGGGHRYRVAVGLR